MILPGLFTGLALSRIINVGHTHRVRLISPMNFRRTQSIYLLVKWFCLNSPFAIDCMKLRGVSYCFIMDKSGDLYKVSFFTNNYEIFSII